VFIKQNDDRFAEHKIIHKKYASLKEMTAVTGNIVFTNFSCTGSVYLPLPMNRDLKYLLLEVLEEMVLKCCHPET
jgi:hypothetical protein